MCIFPSVSHPDLHIDRRSYGEDNIRSHFQRLHHRARQTLPEKWKFNFEKLPISVQHQIFSYLIPTKRLIHCLSRLDPMNPPLDFVFPPQPMNARGNSLGSGYPHRFHIGKKRCSIVKADKPNDVLSYFLVSKRWYYILSHHFFTHNSFAFSSLGEFGRFCNGSGKARVERLVNIEIMWRGSHMPRQDNQVSLRTVNLTWLMRARRLRTLAVYINESDKKYMRRKDEMLEKEHYSMDWGDDALPEDEFDPFPTPGRGSDGVGANTDALISNAFRLAVRKTDLQPNSRRLRSLRTLHGLDNIYQLRGMKWVKFFDVDSKEIGEGEDGLVGPVPVRDWSFQQDVNNMVTSGKSGYDTLCSELDNLHPLSGLERYRPEPDDKDLVKRFYEKADEIYDAVHADDIDDDDSDSESDIDSSESGSEALDKEDSATSRYSDLGLDSDSDIVPKVEPSTRDVSLDFNHIIDISDNDSDDGSTGTARSGRQASLDVNDDDDMASDAADTGSRALSRQSSPGIEDEDIDSVLADTESVAMSRHNTPDITDLASDVDMISDVSDSGTAVLSRDVSPNIDDDDGDIASDAADTQSIHTGPADEDELDFLLGDDDDDDVANLKDIMGGVKIKDGSATPPKPDFSRLLSHKSRTSSSIEEESLFVKEGSATAAPTTINEGSRYRSHTGNFSLLRHSDDNDGVADDESEELFVPEGSCSAAPTSVGHRSGYRSRTGRSHTGNTLSRLRELNEDDGQSEQLFVDEGSCSARTRTTQPPPGRELVDLTVESDQEDEKKEKPRKEEHRLTGIDPDKDDLSQFYGSKVVKKEPGASSRASSVSASTTTQHKKKRRTPKKTWPSWTPASTRGPTIDLTGSDDDGGKAGHKGSTGQTVGGNHDSKLDVQSQISSSHMSTAAGGSTFFSSQYPTSSQSRWTFDFFDDGKKETASSSKHSRHDHSDDEKPQSFGKRQKMSPSPRS
ncbi:hypothetical protein F5Y16DRAFT_374764 [Xylariaceae sp. FL0255]|nr:hypothetical protein F5Y16DRAFT_374764 [Xylariaceae sp. FL0255]